MMIYEMMSLCSREEFVFLAQQWSINRKKKCLSLVLCFTAKMILVL